MIVIGIVGGIASGKSFVSNVFERKGALRVDADRIGHQVLMETETKKLIKDTWGDCVFDDVGNIDRQKLAEIVFRPDSNQLVQLEQITHPKINTRLRDILDESRENYPAAILDAPVLLKAGWNKFCQRILYVDCPKAIRLQRAMQRGWTEEMFNSREASQIDLELKKSISTDTIRGTDSLEEIECQVNDFWQRWGLSR